MAYQAGISSGMSAMAQAISAAAASRVAEEETKKLASQREFFELMTGGADEAEATRKQQYLDLGFTPMQVTALEGAYGPPGAPRGTEGYYELYNQFVTQREVDAEAGADVGQPQTMADIAAADFTATPQPIPGDRGMEEASKITVQQADILLAQLPDDMPVQARLEVLLGTIPSEESLRQSAFDEMGIDPSGVFGTGVDEDIQRRVDKEILESRTALADLVFLDPVIGKHFRTAAFESQQRHMNQQELSKIAPGTFGGSIATTTAPWPKTTQAFTDPNVRADPTYRVGVHQGQRKELVRPLSPDAGDFSTNQVAKDLLIFHLTDGKEVPRSLLMNFGFMGRDESFGKPGSWRSFAGTPTLPKDTLSWLDRYMTSRSDSLEEYIKRATTQAPASLQGLPAGGQTYQARGLLLGTGAPTGLNIDPVTGMPIL